MMHQQQHIKRINHGIQATAKMYPDNILVFTCQWHFDTNVVIGQIHFLDRNTGAAIGGIAIDQEFGQGRNCL